MGNCCSAEGSTAEAPPRPSAKKQLPAAPPPRAVGNKAVYPVQHAGGLAVACCTAKWAAHAAERTPALVKLTPQHAFVALFDGLGEHGDAVAAWCRGCVYEVFLECCQQAPGDVSAALKATFARLDERLLGCDRVPAQARAASGAAGVIAHIDLATRQCTVANVGHAQCLLGRIVGSFNAKLPEGFFLSADHTLKSSKERVRVHKRTLSEPEPEAGGASTRLVEGVEMVQGVTELTRALGFGRAKRAGTGKAGAISCKAEVTEHRLTPTDQHLILASSGFWDVVGPQDAALRSHFYEKWVNAEAAKEQAAAAVAEQDSPAVSPAVRQANTAEHLVLYGMAKVADRLSRRTCQAEPLSVADMVQLPFERPPPTVPAPATPGPGTSMQQPSQQGGCEAAAGSSRQQEGEGEEAAPFIRRELHGDLAAVVVSLRWQNLSVDSQMREVLMAAQRFAGQEDGGGYMRRLVRARWAQVRMLADFHKTYRRTLLRRWWDAADQVYRQGKIQARVLQDRIFFEQGRAVRVSPSLKVRDAAGGSPGKLGPHLLTSAGSLRQATS